jgi:hypothetical protein
MGGRFCIACLTSAVPALLRAVLTETSLTEGAKRSVQSRKSIAWPMRGPGGWGDSLRYPGRSANAYLVYEDDLEADPKEVVWVLEYSRLYHTALRPLRRSMLSFFVVLMAQCG